MRKLHDKLYQEADKADIVHNQVCEELSQLERLAGVGGKQPSATDPVEISMKLNQKIVETTEKLRASTEQKMVFGHMIERLKMELLMTRKTDNESKQKQSTIQHDLATSALQVQQAEIELRVEEDKLEDLLWRLSQKRRSHENRIAGIKKIIEERSLLVDRQAARNRKKEEIMTQADMGVDEEQKLKRMNVIRQLYTTILEKKMSDDEDQLASLENTFHQLRNVTGLTNVEEVVEKFLSRSEKNKQLQHVADDLTKRIDALKEENSKAKVTLDDIIRRTEMNAGNREVYQEVDLIDVAVGSATKQCEDSNGRATRLSVTIGELRETCSRFLSKVKNDVVPIPSVKDLPEKIHELDINLTEMMKAVSANLAKKGEEGQEDDADQQNNNKQGGATFTKLAGSNLGKIMYHKMMTTDPDQSPRNVRVETKMNAVQLGKHAQRTLLDPNFELTNPPPSAQHMPFQRLIGSSFEESEEETSQVIDRTTVKKLANLVVTKDMSEKKRIEAAKRKKRIAMEW